MNKENGDPKVFVSPLSTATVVILQVVSRPRPKPGQVLHSTAIEYRLSYKNGTDFHSLPIKQRAAVYIHNYTISLSQITYYT